MYLASTELSATNLCFMLYQEIVADPTLKITPKVFCMFDGLPSQYASLKTWSFTMLVGGIVDSIHNIYLSN